MANRPAPALALRDGDREKLEGWLRSRSVKAGLVKRARIVLLAADGVTNQEIAARAGASRTTVIQWRNRYLASGVPGLEDHDRSGRPREVDHAAVVTATLTPPPKKSSPSRTGRLGCWPPSSRSAIRPWLGRGRRTGSSRGRPSRSGSPSIPSWSGRSPTSAGSTSARTPTSPRTRSGMHARHFMASRECNARPTSEVCGGSKPTERCFRTTACVMSAVHLSLGSTDPRRRERHQTGVAARRSADGGPEARRGADNAADAPGWGRAAGDGSVDPG